MAKTIQELRRAAGYSSAKDFAAALDIPQSTYARYESQPDAIPLKQAWVIADFLGCSIDMVVGRESPRVEDLRGEFQKLFDRLTNDNQRLVSDYVIFLQEREEKEANARRVMEDRRIEARAMHYERLFLQMADSSEELSDLVVFGTREAIRKAFEDYVSDRAMKQCEVTVENKALNFEIDYRAKRDLIAHNEDGSLELLAAEDMEDESDIREAIDEFRASVKEQEERKTEEGVRKILMAYDRLHSGDDLLAAPSDPL